MATTDSLWTQPLAANPPFLGISQILPSPYLKVFLVIITYNLPFPFAEVENPFIHIDAPSAEMQCLFSDGPPCGSAHTRSRDSFGINNGRLGIGLTVIGPILPGTSLETGYGHRSFQPRTIVKQTLELGFWSNVLIQLKYHNDDLTGELSPSTQKKSMGVNALIPQFVVYLDSNTYGERDTTSKTVKYNVSPLEPRSCTNVETVTGFCTFEPISDRWNYGTCWNQMTQTFDFSLDGGRNIVWRFDEAKPHMRTLSFPGVFPSLIDTLFPATNTSLSNGGRKLASSDCYGSIRFELDRPEVENSDMVFITTSNVHTEAGVKNPYISVYAIPIWIWLLVLFIATSIIQALAKVTRRDDLQMTMCGAGGDQATKLLAIAIEQVPCGHGARTLKIRVTTIAWMFASLVLANGFKSYLKSHFLYSPEILFNHKTTLSRWEEFHNFSLYTFMPSSGLPLNDSHICDCDSENPFCKLSVRESLKALAHELQIENASAASSDPVPFYRPQAKSYICAASVGIVHDDILSWFGSKALRYVSESRQNGRSLEEYFWYDWIGRRKASLLTQLDYIEPFELPGLFGADFDKKVQEGRTYARELYATWTESLNNEQGENADFYMQPNDTTINALFWATRKPHSAFLVTKDMFPWYWNLFKKVMLYYPTIKFAHTGHEYLNYKTTAETIEETKTPFTFRAEGAYIPQAQSLLQRANSLGSSGILKFWKKTQTILFPPLRESSSQQIGQIRTIVRSISMRSSTFVTVTTLLISGLVISGLCAGAEILYQQSISDAEDTPASDARTEPGLDRCLDPELGETDGPEAEKPVEVSDSSPNIDSELTVGAGGSGSEELAAA